MTKRPTLPADEATPLRRWWSDVEPRFEDASARRVDVYVRSMLPPHGARGCQRRLFDRLESLVQRSLLDDVSVHVLGERICLCDTCAATDAGAAAIERVRELDGWGEEYDASASRFFERRQCSSSITGEETDALVPPRVSVGLWVDERLCGVFPCEIDDRTYSVEDFVAALDRGTRPEETELLAESGP